MDLEKRRRPFTLATADRSRRVVFIGVIQEDLMTLLAVSIMALIAIAVALQRQIQPIVVDWSARITINPGRVFILIAHELDDDRPSDEE